MSSKCKPGRRLIEEEQRCRRAASGCRCSCSLALRLRRGRARARCPRASIAALRRPTASAPADRAADSRDRLRPAAAASRALRARREELQRLRETVMLEHIRDAQRALQLAPRQRDLEHLAAIAPAVAVRAAQIHVGEKLHLDVLETVAAASRAATVAGIEAEGADACSRAPSRAARPQTACGSRRTRRRSSPDSIASCVRSATDRPSRHRSTCSAPSIASCAPGASVGLPKCLSSAGYSTSCTSVDLPEPDTPVMHTRRLQRNLDVDVLEIVLARADATLQSDEACRLALSICAVSDRRAHASCGPVR